MHESFIAQAIHRLNLRLLRFGIIGLVLVFIGLALSGRYLYNVITGPASIGTGEVVSLSDPAGRLQYYVNVQGEDHADTGYTYVSSNNGVETTEAYYHALLIRSRLLLVKSPHSVISNQVTGALVKIPSETQREVVDALEAEIPELEGAFLPFMIDATDFYAPGKVGLFFAALIGLISLVCAALAVLRLINPRMHPVYHALAAHGEIDSVVHEIDLEMAGMHKQLGKNVHITRRWLINQNNGLRVVPLRDLIWGYKLVTQQRVNYVPVGKTYSARLLERSGKEQLIPGNENFVHEVLEAIGESAPGMALGYSDDLDHMWKKERARLIAEVDANRQQGTLH